MNRQTPYQVLGVAEDATDEQIRKVYLDKIKQFHPDKFVDEKEKKETEEKCKEINAAYEQINTAEKRASFSPPQWHQSSPFNFDFSSGKDFNDIFKDMFSSFDVRHSRGFQQTIATTVDIDVEEAFAGCKKEFRFKFEFNKGLTKNISLTIEAGIKNNSQYRVKFNDQIALNLVINIVDSTEIRIVNIETGETTSDAKVPFWMFLIGGEITTKIFDKSIRVNVPSSKDSYQQIVLEENGYFFGKNKKRGNHILNVFPDFSTKINKKEKEFFQQLKEAYKQ